MEKTKKQRLVIHDAENPLESRIIEVEIPRKDKILCTESYVLEDLNKYNSGPACNARVIEQAESSSVHTFNASVIPDGQGKYVMSVGGKYSYPLSDSIVEGLSSRFDMEHSFDLQISKPKNKPLSVSMPEIDINESVRNSVKVALINGAEIYKQYIKGGELPKTAYNAVVKNPVSTFGYLASVDNFECFIPKSQIDTQTYPNAELPVGTTIPVVPVKYDIKRDNVIVSNVAYMSVIAASSVDQWLKSKNEPRVATVLFKKFSSYRLSIEGGLRAVLPFTDVNEETAKLLEEKGDNIAGTELEVYCDYVNKHGQLYVTQNHSSQKMWTRISKKYYAGMTVKGTAVSVPNSQGFLNVDIGEGFTFSAVSLRHNIAEGQKVMLSVLYFNPLERKLKLQVF